MNGTAAHSRAWVLLFVLLVPCGLYGFDIHCGASVGYVPELRGAQIEMGVLLQPFPWVDFRGGIEVLADWGGFMSGLPAYNPYRDAYTVSGRIWPLGKKNAVFLEVEHTCTHPVWSYSTQFWDKFAGGNKTSFKIGAYK